MKSLVCLMLLVLGIAAQAAPPNIIIVLTDDQGYGDLSCHGNPVLKTPNLDAFHAQAVRFTDFNVSPTCAPTRSALLTGRHEFRNGVTHTIYERERLTTNAVTLAEVLRSAGYSTGIFGKWHLGDEPAYQPDRRGFEEVFIHGAGGIGQTYPGSCGDAPGNSYFNPAILHNGRFVKTQGYCTDVFFSQAISWIDSQRRTGKPFFAYITPNAPHAPLDVPPEYAAPYTGKVATNVAKFFGMVANVDENFGKLTARLREWNLETNTLVIFMTDNGGTAGVPLWNAGMRGAKVSPFLGGIRVPSFWRWPAGFSGGRDCNALAAHVDVLPTIAEITASRLSGTVKDQIEGRSLLPVLKNPDAPWPDRVLITHVGRWANGEAAESKLRNCSIRNSRYQMVSNVRSRPGQPRSVKWELFDLKADPGQQQDIIAREPQIARRLEAEYDRWWNDIQDKLVNENVPAPAVNPFKERYWAQFGGPRTNTVPAAK